MSTNEPQTDIDVSHIVGVDVTFGSRRRQRCVWCGAIIVDDDFERMAWPLNPDGSDPGPPKPWPVGAIVEITGERGSFRGLRLIPETDWPDSDVVPGEKCPPSGCCVWIDPEVTA